MLRALDRWAARLLLGAGGTLAAVSVLFSYGSSGGRLVWIGVAALAVATAVVVGALAGLPRPAFSREAVVALGFFAAFVAWNGISVLWSIQGDRSWAYFNRGLVYLAFAVVGLWLGPWVRQWAYVLAGVLALPLGWALLGKAIPALGSSGRVARLSSPIGYWNALGLLFAMAVPLAVWLAARREHRHWLRSAGVVYIYALVVGLLLTYSRGGVLAAGVAVVLWLVLGSPRVESAAALLLGGGAGLGVAVWAFSRPGLSSDGQPHSVRASRRRLVRGRLRARRGGGGGARAYLGSLAEERRPLTDARRALVGRVALGVLVAGSRSAWSRSSRRRSRRAGSASSPRSRPTPRCRAAPSTWPTRARRAAGCGGRRPGRRGGRNRRGDRGGTFDLTPPAAAQQQHRRHRAAQRALAVPERDRAGRLLLRHRVDRCCHDRRCAAVRGRDPAVVALAVLAAAYVLHSLVDFDWDFVAVTGPFLLSAGALLGGRAVRDEPRIAWAPLPAVVAIAVALSLLTPWFAERSTDSARAALADRRPLVAYRDARDARSLNPLAIDPLLVQAEALEQLGDAQGARQLYIDAVELQPLNWRPWWELGIFEEGQQDFGRAIPALERAVELERLNPLTTGELANGLGRTGPEPDLRPERREQAVGERLGEVGGRVLVSSRRAACGCCGSRGLGEARLAQQPLQASWAVAELGRPVLVGGGAALVALLPVGLGEEDPAARL